MKFNKLRQLNRSRNFFLKKLKLNIKLLFLDKRKRALPVILAEKMDIILLCYGFGIGDAIIATGLINSLHQRGHRITLLCERRTAFIFENIQPGIKVIIFETLSHLKKTSQVHYDLLIDIFEKNHLSPLRFKIIKLLKPKVSLGFNQSQYKIYDISIAYEEPTKHITNKFIQLLARLGIESETYSYTLTIPKEVENYSKKFINSLDSNKIVIINPYASELSRNMSEAQIEDISRYITEELGYTVIFVGAPSQLARIKSNVGIKFPSPSFLHAAALIKEVDLVISPDTSIVHLCKFYNKNLVCLYNNKVFEKGYQNNIVYGPGYDNAVQILSPGQRIDDIPTATLREAISNIELSDDEHFTKPIQLVHNL